MIRYMDRRALELTDGDRFSTDEGETYHTFAHWGPTGYAEVYVGLALADPTRPILLDRETGTCLVEVQIARVRVAHTIEVDIKAWAREYGTNETALECAADVRGYFTAERIIPEHLDGVVWKAER